MKRRNFAQSFNRQTQDENRVQLLPETTIAFVRAGQIIGSTYRAIEELVRNSIIHGAAKEINITIGTVKNRTGGNSTFIEVKDDGVGIDEYSTREFIGTQHCSSIRFTQGAACTGESLKALAALSGEFRIGTTCAKRRSDEHNFVHDMFQVNGGGFISAPSKPRKRLPCHDDSLRQNVNVTTVSSEKVVRDGSTVAFQSTHNMSAKGTGTSVQLYGLFHKHEVRLRHYQMKSASSSTSEGLDHVNVGQARACIQILAMAFPNVSIRLFQTKSSEPDASWMRPTSSGGDHLPSHLNATQDLSGPSPQEIKAVNQRLIQLCGKQELSKGTLMDVFYTEESGYNTMQSIGSSSLRLDRSTIESSNYHYTRSTSSQCRTESAARNGQWIVYGTLLRNQNDMEAEGVARNRIRQHELVFVNGRLSKHHSILADMIQRLCGAHASTGTCSFVESCMHNYAKSSYFLLCNVI